MDEMLDVSRWERVFTNAWMALWEKVAAFIPNFLAALLILVAGYLLAKLVKRLVAGLLNKLGFDSLSEKIGINNMLKSVGAELRASDIIAYAIFIFIMLVFTLTVLETLSLDAVAHTVETFVLYLPKVLGAALILIVGLLIANLVRELVQNTASHVADDYADAVGSIVYGVLVVVISLLAIGQLEIDASFLYTIIEILLIAAGVALALTLGLGTRDISQQLVSGLYAREQFKPGSQISVNGQQGELVEVGTVTATIRSEDGTLYHVPNHTLVSSVVSETK